MKTVSNELHNKYAHNMMTSSELRRINKPIVEKKRRERINGCLEELKTLLLQSTNKHESSASKLEKADILEMAVKHLRQIQPGTQQQQQTVGGGCTEDALQYKEGYNDCAREVAAYLDHTDSLNDSDKSRVLCQLSARLSNINNNINTQSGIAPTINSTFTNSACIDNQSDASVHSIQPSFLRQSVSPVYPTTTISKYAMNVDYNYNCSSGRNSTLQSPSSANATENTSYPRRRFKSRVSEDNDNIKSRNNFGGSSNSRAYNDEVRSAENYTFGQSDNFRILHDSTFADRVDSRENVNSRNNARWARDEDFRSSASVVYSHSEDGADIPTTRPIRSHRVTSRRHSAAVRTISSTVVMATSSADDVIPRLNISDVSWPADSSCTASTGFEPTSSCAADSATNTTPLVESSYSDRSSMVVSPKSERRCGSELQRSSTDVNGNNATVQSKPCTSTQNDDDASMWRPW